MTKEERIDILESPLTEAIQTIIRSDYTFFDHAVLVAFVALSERLPATPPKEVAKECGLSPQHTLRVIEGLIEAGMIEELRELRSRGSKMNWKFKLTSSGEKFMSM